MTGEVKFVADAMLGKLAKWLRIFGYDTLYYRGTKAESLIDLAVRSGRVILTRNTRIRKVAHGPEVVFIEGNRWEVQLRQVLERFHAPEQGRAFTRCVNCNTELITIEREDARERVPEYIFHTHRTLRTCPECKRVYWQGTHQQRMEGVIRRLLSESGDRDW